MALQSSLQKYIGEIKNPFAKVLISGCFIIIATLWYANTTGNKENKIDCKETVKKLLADNERLKAEKDSIIAEKNMNEIKALNETIRFNDERIKSQDSALLAFKILKK